MTPSPEHSGRAKGEALPPPIPAGAASAGASEAGTGATEPGSGPTEEQKARAPGTGGATSELKRISIYSRKTNSNYAQIGTKPLVLHVPTTTAATAAAPATAATLVAARWTRHPNLGRHLVKWSFG